MRWRRAWRWRWRPTEGAAAGGGAGAAEAGQHIIYVTTGDGEQSQLLISALTNAVPASVPSVDQLVRFVQGFFSFGNAAIQTKK